MKKVAMFASGKGSNFDSMVTHTRSSNKALFEVKLLICDNKNALVIEKAKKHSIPYYVFDLNKFKHKDDYEREVLKILNDNEIDFVVLAGYMRIIGKILLDTYKIINVHPTLLPKFRGNNGIERSYNAGEKYLGLTIHWVDAGIDTGEIIFQTKFKKKKLTLKEADDKIHDLENANYWKVVNKLIKKGKL